ncbi:hypothetical protein Patl1_05705 [Pistacia atlantica]|uniref:Uncharacterized protein n=1 Tax=Pistacia atlantica TaxID=434234 RepID=A0ACC1BPP0_9ROSI|nr:hypothetical protein Patl1_05705 [Pistacia atlantica]
MAGLGFRHPQFSEELAWLPAWLQPHQVEASNEYQTTTSPPLKDLEILQRNICEVKDAAMPSSEEGRYNSCHLFLSGEDNSLVSSGPSSDKVYHFRLHLSSNGASEYTQCEIDASQVHCDSTKFLSLQQADISQCMRQNTNVNKVLSTSEVGNLAVSENTTNSNKVLPMRQTEISAGSRGYSYHSKLDNNATGLNLLVQTSFPKTVENLDVQSPIRNNDGRRQCKDKLNVRYHKCSDINNAVELSISASEALVIHEQVNSESDSEALSTAAILEATLRVKQARLKGLEDGFNYPNREIEETDLLFDLDDLTMADAYEDVGLSFVGPNEKLVCSSDASLVKETPFSENHHGCNSGFKDVDQIQQKKIPVDPALGLNGSRLASNVDHLLRQSAEDVSQVFSVAQEEADAPVQLQQNNSKSIQKLYVNETSFLSESADVAPDENSFVQQRELGSINASQSSVPFEGSYKKTDEEILISQNLSSPILSLVDPLCSVVPCSVSSVNTNSLQTHSENDIDVNANCEVETVHSTSCLKGESVNRDRQDVPRVTGDVHEAPVRRQLTLLKTYSTIPPKDDTELQMGSFCYDRLGQSECSAEIVSLEPNMGGIRHQNNKCSEGFLPFKSAFKCTVDRDKRETENTAVISKKFIETTNHKKRYDEHAKDGAELLLPPLKESMPPCISNQWTRRQMCASKLVHNCVENTSLEEAAVQETTGKLHKIKDFQNEQSEFNNSLDNQGPARKRVRFSDVEVEPQQMKDVQNLLPSHKVHSNTRAGNWSKHSNAWVASRFQQVFANGIKDGKRLIFQGMKFLLTGLPSCKEKEIKGLIPEYGGMVLLDIPSLNARGKRSLNSNFQQHPIVLCHKKLKTIKFLYGCAVNAFILKVKWLTDSIAAGSVLLPEKYMILSGQADVEISGMGKVVSHNFYKLIFDRVGIMLYGKNSFCTKFAIIFKHGGGQVFKTLQWLVQSLDNKKIFVGAIVADDERRASRHLRQIVSERNIPMVSSGWIIRSLHSGKLLPMTQNKHTPLPIVKGPEVPISVAWSEEI